jgi:hypothetical protein
MRRAGLLAALVVVALAAWIWLDRPGKAGRADRPRPAEIAAPEEAPAPEAPSDPRAARPAMPAWQDVPP